MEITQVSRRQLLDILLSISGVHPSEARTIAEPRLEFEANATVGIVWREGQADPPVPGLVIVQKARQRDFFAWVTTFAPTLRPFSAFFRVVDEDTANTLLNSDRPRLQSKFLSGLIGLTIAEAVSSRNAPGLPVRVTLRECLGTASFCLARTLVMGLQSPARDVIDDWGVARELIENRRTSFLTELRFLWDIVSQIASRKSGKDLTDEQEGLLICCCDIMEDGEISLQNWSRLTSRVSEVADLRGLMGGTREERVLTLERLLVSVVRSSESSRNSKGFICGYLAGLVAPGTLDHIGLLAEVNRLIPTAIMWYGLCAGLRGNQATYLYAGAVGRRVTRELTRFGSWTDPPTCDIAVGELAVLMMNSRNMPDWLRGNGPYLDVEIAPGVTCALRNSDSGRDAMDSVKPFPPSDLRRLYDRLADISTRLGEAQRELSRISGAGLGSRETKSKGRKLEP
jgi:hypothetical protein